MRHLFCLSFLILFFGCNSRTSQNDKFSDVKSIQLKTSFVDLKNKKVDLNSFKGNKIIVSYWATWCRPCIKEMPAIIRAQEILKNDNITFLLVSDENILSITNFKNKKKYNLKFLKSVRSNETLGIYSLPTAYIFNEQGIKIETIVGAVSWDSKQIIKKLKTL